MNLMRDFDFCDYLLFNAKVIVHVTFKKSTSPAFFDRDMHRFSDPMIDNFK